MDRKRTCICAAKSWAIYGVVLAALGCAGAESVRVPVPEARPLGNQWPSYRAVEDAESAPEEGSEIPLPPAEPTGVLTLKEALALALQRSPALAASSWEVRVREGRTVQAGLRPNPEVEAEVEDFGGSGELGGFRSAESTVFLSQLIETRGKRSKRQRAAELDAEVAGWEYEETRIGVVADVVQAFVAVLAAQQRVALSEDLIEVSESSRASVERLVVGGATSSVEVTRATVEIGTARIDLASARRGLAAARIRLAALWGSRQARFDRAEGDLSAVDEPPPASMLRELFLRTPALARWDREIARREAVVALEEAQSVPSFRASAGLRRLSDADETAFFSQISMPFPLFDRNQGARAAARSDTRKARQERQAIEVRLAADLEAAYQELLARYEEVRELRGTILPSATEAFEGMRRGYAQGRFRNLEVLDAQRRLFQLRLREIDALDAYHTARADVERITGVPLDPALELDRERRP